MKTNSILKLTVLFAVFLFASCAKDNNDLSSILTTTDIAESAKLISAGDDISNLVESQLNISDGILGKNVQFLPSCANVTRNPLTGVPAIGGNIIKTIDFGTGCSLTNGNTLKGKIILTFPYFPNATSHIITCSFDNFYHNNIKIEGTKTFTRTITTNGPTVVVAMDIVATHPNGHIHHKVGTVTRTMTAGYSTPLDIFDNVYSITGSWTNTSNNMVMTASITSPIIVKLNCNHIVQGIISYVRGVNTATLDYGDGVCDDVAIFTLNGIVHTITL